MSDEQKSRGQAVEYEINAEIDRREVAKIVACRIPKKVIEIKHGNYRALLRHMMDRETVIRPEARRNFVEYRGYRVQPIGTEPAPTEREKFITDIAVSLQIPEIFIAYAAGTIYDAAQEFRERGI